MRRDPEVVDLDMDELRALLARAKVHLPPDDYARLDAVVATLTVVMRIMHERGATIARMRRLFGLAKSEKTKVVLSKPDDGDTGSAADASVASASAPSDGGERAPPAPEGHGRHPASAYPNARIVEVCHSSLRVGDRCPECKCGNLHALEPTTIVRIVGQQPLAATCWRCERLRCGTCGLVYVATAPEEAKGPKHTESAAAMMAYFRFRAGVPHHRLAELQAQQRTPLPASTQWEVLRERVRGPKHVFRELLRIGAQGTVFHNDDTSMPILDFMGKRRAKLALQGKLPSPDRTGLFTTGIVSIVDGRTLTFFLTGRRHAGENLAAVLRHRAVGLEPPILMSDALDRNVPKAHEVVQSNCSSHARRQFVDQADNYPRECRLVLEAYGKVFSVDDACRTEGLSDVERLRRHQAESGPVMEAMKTWMEAQRTGKLVEPNSGLGDAIGYVLDHWDKLTLFLRVPGAPIDNNAAERALKTAIRHRNNSLFYRTARGARLGDVYMTVIANAEAHGENPLEYLEALMRHEEAVVAAPAAWLPWTYRATLTATA